MKTRIIIIIGIGALFVGAVLAYAFDEPPGAGDPDVVAGFYPLAFAAEEVGGSGLDVRNLTPPGAEPHDIEVSARDVQQLQSAKLVLLMGHGFQPQLEDATAGAGGEVLELLDTPGLDLHPSGDPEAGPDDPHVWLDPVLYGALVRSVAEALGRPGAAGRMLARLRRLDREYRAGLSDCRRHEIVTGHQAFGYLARRYGLRQVAILGLSPEAEPSPAELADVVDEVRRSGATTVFSETLLSPELADTVARETGAGTAVLDPIEGLTDRERARGEDYFSLMRDNLAALRAGLGCR